MMLLLKEIDIQPKNSVRSTKTFCVVINKAEYHPLLSKVTFTEGNGICGRKE